VEIERDGDRRERQCEEPSGQIAQPFASTQQSGEPSAHSSEHRQRGRAQPYGCADGHARTDRYLHDRASHGQPNSVCIDLGQSVRGPDDLLDEPEEELDQTAARSSR
jgi:hypothetical protein